MLIGKPTKKDLMKCWESDKNFFLKQFAKDQPKRLNKDQLEHRFVDMNGIRYDGFPKNLSIPIERMGKTMEFMQWMSAGLSSVELDKLLDAADKALMNGLKTGKNAARIGAVLEEIRARKQMVLHTELLYNYLAVQWIREDEDPLVFNNEIHMQKVEQFKKEVAESNSYFFFQQPELKMLNDLLNLTQSEWMEYWRESLIKQSLLGDVVKIYSSDQGSEDTVKTATKQ